MATFKGWHFAGGVIPLAVRWYCRHGVSCRDLKAMLAERGVAVDHTTTYRRVQRHAVVLVAGRRGAGQRLTPWTVAGTQRSSKGERKGCGLTQESLAVCG